MSDTVSRPAQILDRLSKSLEGAGEDRHSSLAAAGSFDLALDPGRLAAHLTPQRRGTNALEAPVPPNAGAWRA
jgi:hypothetical protein